MSNSPDGATPTGLDFDIEALLTLWTDPIGADTDAVARFRRSYVDPVPVNGSPRAVADLVTSARALQSALGQLERTVLSVTRSADQIAVAFRLSGLQTGPFSTSAGVLPPTGRLIQVRVIDILTISEGRISNVWMCADELGTLVALDAVALRP